MLTYLTVFKARLGTCNLVLDLTGFAHQPTEALSRKLRKALARQLSVPVNLQSRDVLGYLSEKHLITANLKTSGRYKGVRFCGEVNDVAAVCDRNGTSLDELSVFETDLWLSSPVIPSTVGVPTPENLAESIELSFQLRLLTRSKNTWTPAGHLITALRGADMGRPSPENPFALGADGIGYLRQALAEDGIVTVELLRVLAGAGPTVTRDEVALRFDEVMVRTVERCRDLGMKGNDLKEARDFRDLIVKTSKKAQGRTGSGGPGVLEHRVAPRLEWLTDLGYLSKRGLPRNGFEYRVEESLVALLKRADPVLGEKDWVDDVVAEEWLAAPQWARPRERVTLTDDRRAIASSYNALKRRIGPTPIREVAFLVAITLGSSSVRVVREILIDLAANHDGVALAGGRYTREPENIFMTDAAVAALGT